MRLAELMGADPAYADEERISAVLHDAEHDLLDPVESGDLGHVRELVECWIARDQREQVALSLALRELQEARQDAGAYETAAWAAHHAGDDTQAVELITRALEKRPKHARSLWRAGAILESRGDHVAAERFREDARAQDPYIELMVGVSTPESLRSAAAAAAAPQAAPPHDTPAVQGHRGSTP